MRTRKQSRYFIDKDRDIPRHDLACAYLCTRADQIAEDHAARHPDRGGHRKPTAIQAHTEVPVGGGFIDVEISYSLRCPEAKSAMSASGYFCPHSGELQHDVRRRIGIEVKIAPETMGQILRQISYYNEPYVDGSGKVTRPRAAFYLVTDYPLSEPDKFLLKQEEIQHYVLGHQFDDWGAKQVQATTSDEL